MKKNLIQCLARKCGIAASPQQIRRIRVGNQFNQSHGRCQMGTSLRLVIRADLWQLFNDFGHILLKVLSQLIDLALTGGLQPDLFCHAGSLS
jgi:hypothetical protein